MTQEDVIAWLGPSQINDDVGLAFGDHSGLRAYVFNDDDRGVSGLRAESVWIGSFDELWELAAARAPLQLSGSKWYHHVAVRGVQGDTIWLANSAPGYASVWENLSRSDYQRLGAWRATWVR